MKNVVIFIQTVLSFVLSRKMINIYNDIARKHGNVTVKDFREHVLLYHFLNDENHAQIVSPGKKKLIRPHVLKHE